MPGPEVIKKFMLSMNVFLVINLKMPTICHVNILSRKNSILGISEPEKMLNCLMFLYL